MHVCMYTGTRVYIQSIYIYIYMHATQVKDAAKKLAEMSALRIDRDDVLSPTELGRVVSHYYISVSLTLYI